MWHACWHRLMCEVNRCWVMFATFPVLPVEVRNIYCKMYSSICHMFVTTCQGNRHLKKTMLYGD